MSEMYYNIFSNQTIEVRNSLFLQDDGFKGFTRNLTFKTLNYAFKRL